MATVPTHDVGDGTWCHASGTQRPLDGSHCPVCGEWLGLLVEEAQTARLPIDRRDVARVVAGLTAVTAPAAVVGLTTGSLLIEVGVGVTSMVSAIFVQSSVTHGRFGGTMDVWSRLRSSSTGPLRVRSSTSRRRRVDHVSSSSSATAAAP